MDSGLPVRRCSNAGTRAGPDSYTDASSHTDAYSGSRTCADTHTDARPYTYSDTDRLLPAMGAGQGLCGQRQGHEPRRLLSVQGSRMVLVDCDRV